MRKMFMGSIVATAMTCAASMASAVPESSVDYNDSFGGSLSFIGGCVVSQYFVATNTTVGGGRGPAGYRRYIDIGFVHFCLPF